MPSSHETSPDRRAQDVLQAAPHPPGRDVTDLLQDGDGEAEGVRRVVPPAPGSVRLAERTQPPSLTALIAERAGDRYRPLAAALRLVPPPGGQVHPGDGQQ